MRGIGLLVIGLGSGVVGCAKGAAPGGTPDGGGSGGGDGSTGCGELCDTDGDGVLDSADMCPATPAGQPVNQVGCADSQLTSTLEPHFPPYNLTWTSSGDLGRAGGLVWTYLNIQRKDLFHIDWVICDDPTTPCGLSLDGPIDATEGWTMSAPDSDMANGKIQFTGTTHIALDDGTAPMLNTRLTVNVVGENGAVTSFAAVAALGITMPRLAGFGAEIAGTGFTITALEEVQDPTSGVWTPYLDYYDAAPTPMAGMQAAVSFGGSFYSK